MKKFTTSLVITFLMLSAYDANAQQVIASAGEYFEGENISLSWTLGEPVIETTTGADIVLTQGFQQPYSFYLSQIINIPVGWSGVSGFIDPLNKDVENIMGNFAPDFVILASMSEFYYPEGGVNTIGNWNFETGYKIKANNEFTITLTGSKIGDPTVEMAEGWNLIPVLNACGANLNNVFADISGLVIVKEVAGVNIFWPAFGIETLEDLEPGKAYLVMMSEIGSFTYPACARNANAGKLDEKPQNVTPWNDLSYTATSHTIAFTSHVLSAAGIQTSDVIGAFTPGGLCAGRVEVLNLSKNIALVAFADDEITIENDGFQEGEMLQFKVFRAEGNEEINLNVEYDPALPNLGIFTGQGISAAKSAVLVAPAISETADIVTQVYPNPSHGNFNLTMSYWPDNLQIILMDSRGRVIRTVAPGDKPNGSSLQLNFVDLPNGVYFLRLINHEMIEMKKIVIN